MKISVIRVNLARQNELLERIAVALERIAGPPPSAAENTPYQAQLSDLSMAAPGEIERVLEAQREFAVNHMLEPGSPAFIEAILQYEKAVSDAYGPQAVSQLPWRVKPASRQS